MKKAILPLFLASLSVAVHAENLIVDDSGAYFKKGITVGESATAEPGTIRFDNQQFQGFDGYSWRGMMSQEQKVVELEALSEEEVHTFAEEARSLCEEVNYDSTLR